MISGKGFADRCDWVYDPRYPDRRRFSYAEAPDGAWVFLNGDYTNSFLETFPFLAMKRFYLIVHNSDRSFTEETLQRLRKHVYHIFAINTAVRHPRVTTIPLGFADNQLEFLSTFRPETVERTIEVYLNIKPHHNWEKRGQCIEAVKGDPRVVNRERVSVPEYYADLCRSQFVLCPEGTGMDTHRVYEAILCGATPVVLRNALTHLYEGLPVCLVNSWTDPYVHPPKRPVSFTVQTFLVRNA
jgi:hypothetical protein